MLRMHGDQILDGVENVVETETVREKSQTQKESNWYFEKHKSIAIEWNIFEGKYWFRNAIKPKWQWIH